MLETQPAGFLGSITIVESSPGTPQCAGKCNPHQLWPEGVGLVKDPFNSSVEIVSMNDVTGFQEWHTSFGVLQR